MKACVKKSISLAWFYKSTLHINLAENGAIHKIFHPTETHKILGDDNLDKHINNVSF